MKAAFFVWVSARSAARTRGPSDGVMRARAPPPPMKGRRQGPGGPGWRARGLALRWRGMESADAADAMSDVGPAPRRAHQDQAPSHAHHPAPRPRHGIYIPTPTGPVQASSRPALFTFDILKKT